MLTQCQSGNTSALNLSPEKQQNTGSHISASTGHLTCKILKFMPVHFDDLKETEQACLIWKSFQEKASSL